MTEPLKSPIGERLRLFRESKGWSQVQMAEAIGGAAPGYKKNEQGLTLPNSKALVGLGDLGVNLNWLLLGDGPMLRADLEPRHSARINKDALAKVVEVMIRTADPGETPAQTGVKAVEYYTYLLDSGKITLEGVGDANLNKAA